MFNLGYTITVLLAVNQICESAPLPQQGSGDEEESRNSSGPSGLLELPNDANEGADEEEEPTTRRPRPAATTTTTTRRPANTDRPSGLLETTRRPQRGARIVFQPLWQVALNAATRGITSALVPIVNNEQPTGVQYGSVPLQTSFEDTQNEEDGQSQKTSSSVKSSSSSSSTTALVNSVLGPMRGFFG